MQSSPCEGHGVAQGTIFQTVCQLGEAKIYYDVLGSGSPVVLIHGLSGSSRWWCKNVPGLAEHYTVYLMDLMGFGRGRKQRFILSETANLLVQWMDAIGVEKASLVGHSMGGYIAAEIAGRYPKYVDRLVLAAPAVLRLGRHYSRHAFNLTRELRFMSLDFIQTMVRDAFAAGLLTILRATADILDADLSDLLPNITAPTLLIWGEKDGVVPLSFARQLQTYLPQARLEIIPKIGHNLMWEDPARFNQLVVEFLQDQS